MEYKILRNFNLKEVWNALEEAIKKEVQVIITDKYIPSLWKIYLCKDFTFLKPILRLVEKEFQEEGEIFIGKMKYITIKNKPFNIKILIEEEQTEKWKIQFFS